MIDRIDPSLLTPMAEPSKDMTPEAAFEKELSRWVVKELTAPMFKEGSPLEGASHLQSLFQDALSDRLVGDLHPTRPAQLRSFGPAPMPESNPQITSGFGMRSDPIKGGRRMHSGVDLAAPIGTAVQSARGGVVTFAGERGSYGNLVVVDHGGGLETRYAHLSRIDVRAGDQVGAGRRLGAVGSTGRSTGAHLHFETRMGGAAVDPLQHVPDFATQVIGKTGR